MESGPTLHSESVSEPDEELESELLLLEVEGLLSRRRRFLLRLLFFFFDFFFLILFLFRLDKGVASSKPWALTWRGGV
jgi:hypothetical protein